MATVSVLAIPGSLRAASYNRALLHAAAELSPAWIDLTVFETLGSVPVFNEDIEHDRGSLWGVEALRVAVAETDGVLIATPEYNRSVPGVVKNMIDWLSRGDPEGGLGGKPVAVTGATTGPWGTRISQMMLRQMLLSVEAAVLPRPALFIAGAADLFDHDGSLIDQPTGDRLAAFVEALGRWILRLADPTEPGRA